MSVAGHNVPLNLYPRPPLTCYIMPLLKLSTWSTKVLDEMLKDCWMGIFCDECVQCTVYFWYSFYVIYVAVYAHFCFDGCVTVFQGIAHQNNCKIYPDDCMPKLKFILTNSLNVIYGICIIRLPIFVMSVSISVIRLVIITKWKLCFIRHCLRLGNEYMVCSACFTIC